MGFFKKQYKVYILQRKQNRKVRYFLDIIYFKLSFLFSTF
jgi:hypothetical protein